MKSFVVTAEVAKWSFSSQRSEEAVALLKETIISVSIVVKQITLIVQQEIERLYTFMFTVQVLYESDKKPAKSKRVSIGVDGLTGGVSREEWTNDSGRACIDLGNRDYVKGKIYVDGSVKYQGYIDKVKTVYI